MPRLPGRRRTDKLPEGYSARGATGVARCRFPRVAGFVGDTRALREVAGSAVDRQACGRARGGAVPGGGRRAGPRGRRGGGGGGPRGVGRGGGPPTRRAGAR